MDTEILDGLIQGRVEPYIYAFETNTVPNYLKVGDTYRPVEVRLNEWRKLYTDLKKRYEHIAKLDEETYFRDYAVHEYLIQNDFPRIGKSEFPKGQYYSVEFFKNATEQDIERAIRDIQKSYEEKDGRYDFYNVNDHLPVGNLEFERDADWEPRDNQKKVIERFVEAVKKEKRSNLLLYAVMRFGKSFTSLCCAKEIDAKLIVVVCGKTAVKLEWQENVQRPKILKGFEFVDSEKMRNQPSFISKKLKEGCSVVVFLTLQDLIGEEIKKKHKELFKLNKKGKIDLLIIDETHFGARAEEYGKVLGESKKKKLTKTEKKNGYDESLESLDDGIKEFHPKVKLHLSGTPYRILLENEFNKEDIVGIVQYSDIIDEKDNWNEKNIDKDEWENPYYGFPQMLRFAFDLNESAKAKLADLENNGYAYDLNELFSPKSTSKGEEGCTQFKYRKEVLDLLRAIDGSQKDDNIFSFLNYKKIKDAHMCHHIVMILPYCASCDAMEELLNSEKFNNLNNYEIVNIAGFKSNAKFNKPDYALHVKAKIKENEATRNVTGLKGTIALTVGKMLTGSTVKEWDTMIFLRNTSSPQDYDQAIFRLQNPYIQIIKSSSSDSVEKVIKKDLKPQTILVDFDPVRMYTLQHKKSLITNINKAERGNELLEERLKRELEIAPIICLNHGKLQRVDAANIVDSIRNYNKNKSVMDETFDVDIDMRIFENEEVKSIIQKQPEITDKGIKFEGNMYSSSEESDTDIEIPDSPNQESDKKKEDKPKEKKDEEKELVNRLQGYYFKLLLFAFLSENYEKNVSDIIKHIKKDSDGKRMGKNLQIDVKDLEIVRDNINPSILSYLENKIQNINQLGKEITPDQIDDALRKLSRLSASEVVTPSNVALELVSSLPNDITGMSRFLDIASKTGEFANAVIQRYGDGVKGNVYSIPTSPVTYECTRKVYHLLGMPVEHVYDAFVSYDLINKKKDKKIIEELKKMKFNAVVGNPPYQEKDGGAQASAKPIYNKFVDVAKIIKPQCISMIMPSRWYAGGKGKELDIFRQEMLNDNHIEILHDYVHPEDVFPGTNNRGGVCSFLWNQAYDNSKELTKVVTHEEKGKVITVQRNLKTEGVDILVRYQTAVDILKKVMMNDFTSFSAYVSPRKPFGIESNFSKSDKFKCEKNKLKNPISCYGKSWEMGYIEKDLVKNHTDWIGKWKVFTARANNIGTELNDDNLIAQIGKPNCVCTEAYLILGIGLTPKLDRSSAQNLCTYCKTKFMRFMHSIAKASHDATSQTYQFVPLQNFTSNSDIDWSQSIEDIDNYLFDKYKLSKHEREFINTHIKEMKENGNQ